MTKLWLLTSKVEKSDTKILISLFLYRFSLNFWYTRYKGWKLRQFSLFLRQHSQGVKDIWNFVRYFFANTNFWTMSSTRIRMRKKSYFDAASDMDKSGRKEFNKERSVSDVKLWSGYFGQIISIIYLLLSPLNLTYFCFYTTVII